MRRLVRGLWNGLAGAIACTSLPLSILAVGWTQRAMQRAALASWHRASGAPPAEFAAFAGSDPVLAPHARWPGWLAADSPARSWRRALGGLRYNARLGAATAFNTWVLTLPACGLWLFAWYDGWNNSFHKGYEQAAVGPVAGLLGVALFIAAMLYVPMAQARQAATGSWRSFYDFGLVTGLVRRRWWSCVRLAGLYAAASVPVTLLKTAPMAFEHLPGYAAESDAEVLARLESFYFVAGAFVFAVFLALRLAAARVYAAGVVEGVRAGALAPEQLGVFERIALGRLDLLRVEAVPPRHPVLRLASGASRLAWRAGAGAAAVALWFAFVAQIFVSEFLNYHPVVGWLNQPLVQLPWFRYLPPGLG